MADTIATLHRLDICCPPTEQPNEDRGLDQAQCADLAAGVLASIWELGWEELELEGQYCMRLHHPDQEALKQAAEAVLALVPHAGINLMEVPDRNWATLWREYFTAVLCGEDFIVVAPWMLEDQLEYARHTIIIDPKMAFGTGHHPTTAMCLEAVSTLYRAGRLPSAFRFLDVGTGSGILSIGCAKLGGKGVAVDIDPLATENSLENIEVNAVAASIVVGTGGVEAVAPLVGEERFDLVLANILAQPVIEMAPALSARVKDGGALVLSGMLTIQWEEVAAAYSALGWPDPSVMQDGEWAALVWSGAE